MIEGGEPGLKFSSYQAILFSQGQTRSYIWMLPIFFVQIVRSTVAVWFLALPGASRTINPSTFLSQLNSLADGKQLMQSASLLAHHRPLFNATIIGKLFTLPFAPWCSLQHSFHVENASTFNCCFSMILRGKLGPWGKFHGFIQVLLVKSVLTGAQEPEDSIRNHHDMDPGPQETNVAPNCHSEGIQNVFYAPFPKF